MRRFIIANLACVQRTMSTSSRLPIKGVCFDMDGTLTNTGAIDFATMRARCGVPPKVDIIAHCEAQPEPRRSELLRIVEEEEEHGLARMSLRPDCKDIISTLTAAGIHRALLTRNNDSAMTRTLALLESEDAFSIMLSRSFTPVKPHPAALHHICELWKCSPDEIVMCGDSIDDMACGRAAGATTVLIGDNECKHFQEALPLADFSIASLRELEDVLRDNGMLVESRMSEAAK